MGNDAVPQGRGHIAAINLVFLHFEDDLAHGSNLGGCLSRRKPPVRQLREVLVRCRPATENQRPEVDRELSVVFDSKNALRYKLLGKSELWNSNFGSVEHVSPVRALIDSHNPGYCKRDPTA